jgi:dTDP-4-dehydrorhamnose 3,5-epimerase
MMVTRLAIPEVLLVTPRVHADDRGYFMEVWHAASYAAAGLDAAFVQDNQSGSTRGVLRGLHYQVQHPQGKLVRALSGEIFDVAVDLRRSSTTFGQWVGARLSAENRRQLFVPSGFAHGFLVTSEQAEVSYKCTNYYFREHERTLSWNDPDIGIEWPLPAGVPPTLSEKDQFGRALRDAEVYL